MLLELSEIKTTLYTILPIYMVLAVVTEINS